MKSFYESKVIVMAAFMTVMLVSGCGKQSPRGGPHSGRLPQVGFVVIAPESTSLTIELPGRTVPRKIAEVRPQVSGIILKRLFKEGANVKRGQVLYQIDSATYQAACDNARAGLASAKAAHASAVASLAQVKANAIPLRLRAERFKKLVADKAVSQQDFDDASAAVEQIKAGILAAEAGVKSAVANIAIAKAALTMAQINLSYTKVKAPISGRIGRSLVTTGALVTAGQPMALATIQQLDPIYVDVPQSSTELLHLNRQRANGHIKINGDAENKVKLILEDGSAYGRTGILQFSDVTVDPTTGSFILRAVFPNKKGILLPGMFVRAELNEGVNENAILVPQQGVSRDPKGNPFALIIDSKNKAIYRPLTLGRAIADSWLVLKGLASGDRVIVEGLNMLRPGTVVKPTPFATATQVKKRRNGGN